MKWIETITPKQAVEELGVPYHGWMREMDRAWISEDQKYSVMSRLPHGMGQGRTRHDYGGRGRWPERRQRGYPVGRQDGN